MNGAVAGLGPILGIYWNVFYYIITDYHVS